MSDDTFSNLPCYTLIAQVPIKICTNNNQRRTYYEQYFGIYGTQNYAYR